MLNLISPLLMIFSSIAVKKLFPSMPKQFFCSTLDLHHKVGESCQPVAMREFS